jgi:hypothetical protein
MCIQIVLEIKVLTALSIISTLATFKVAGTIVSLWQRASTDHNLGIYKG